MITYQLSDELKTAVQATIDAWQNNKKIQRLWAHDATLWTNADEASWLGWLDIVDAQLANASLFTAFAEDVKQAGFKNILLLGMGGSSLCPEVLKLTFGKTEGFPEIYVLDSTDPAQVRAWAKAHGGHAILFRAADKSRGAFHPLSQTLHTLHQRLKMTFDPMGILNRGRLYPDF